MPFFGDCSFSPCEEDYLGCRGRSAPFFSFFTLSFNLPQSVASASIGTFDKRGSLAFFRTLEVDGSLSPIAGRGKVHPREAFKDKDESVKCPSIQSSSQKDISFVIKSRKNAQDMPL